eukprot:TRINITY_DN1333_c0_g1_i1.p1 TRINITY_DN1333_c0_g1~~TRINITY_DN1333_c0_g1_i1.p1  ORF type:complete len:185 (-),score=39.67 TRINITY_DN1333_c0_g1_i1:51-605(-)
MAAAFKRLFWQPYVSSLERRPLLTKAATASTLMAVGDGLSQFLEKKPKYDFARTGRMALIGFAMSGPLMHGWYKVLDRLVPGAPTTQNTIKKIAADQLLFTPLSLGAFLTLLPVLEGKNTEQVKDRIKSDYKPILLTNWSVWPFVQFVNFKYIPVDQRVLFVTILGIFWNAYLSYMGNRNANKK